MAATAAAAPQPTSTISCLLLMWKSLPRLEPMAEPVSTIGASAPTDPPKPMVSADATSDVQQLWAFSFDCLVEMAYSTRVMPWEMLSLTTYLMKSMVSQMPTTGKTRYSQLKLSATKSLVRRFCIRAMSLCNEKAASDANTPISNAMMDVA